jgi:hypothetical protein
VSQESLLFLSVRIDNESLAEMKSERMPLLVVPREDVNRIELVRAVEAAHPILLSGCGFVLLATGLVSLPLILSGFIFGGPMHWLFFLLPTVALVGGWMVYDALRRVPLLWIDTIRGVRKLAFQGRAERQELIDFIRQAEAKFGYTIEVKL